MRNLLACCMSVLALTGCYQQPESKAAPAQSPASLAAVTAPAPATPSEVGRYVIVHSPHIERDTVLLDTETGQTWQLSQLTDINGEPTVWVPMNRMDTSDDWNKVIAQYGRKSQSHQTKTSADAAATSPAGDGSGTPPQQ